MCWHMSMNIYDAHHIRATKTNHDIQVLILILNKTTALINQMDIKSVGR